MRRSTIDVAVSILRADDGRVLMAERTAGQISPGFWELPGGKVDPGETPEAAARRELHEEIGVEPRQLRPWLTYTHRFPLRNVRLHFFRVAQWDGTPHGREGQRIAWVHPAHPAVGPILPSNERALTALALPPLYAVAGARGAGGQAQLLARLIPALRAGLRLIQVREPDLAPDQRIAFARLVHGIAAPHGARVLLTGSALEARRAGVAGVHSTARELRRLFARPPVKLWLTSCHDAADLAHAAALGADAVVLSPVLASDSHPDKAPLGWEGLERLVAGAALGVYAQGGMTRASLERAQRAGALGVATTRWSE